MPAASPLLLSILLVAATLAPVLAGDEGAFGPEPLVRNRTPVLTVAADSHDWGQIEQGSEFTHDFEIRNDGTDTLHILKVKSGCDCATTRADESIEPGEVGIVHFTVDTRRLRGAVRKTAKVYTNDPARPEVVLTLAGRVVTRVATDPEQLRLSALAGEPGELVVTLSPATEEPLRIDKVETRYSNAIIDGPEPLGDGRFRMVIRMVPRARPGTKRDTLFFKLRDAAGKVRREQVPLVLIHRDPIDIQPGKSVRFSRRDTASWIAGEVESLEREVEFRRTVEGGPFRILDVDVGELAPWIRTRVEPLPDDGGYRIVVTLFERRTDRNGISGRIRVTTDRPGAPERRLFVSAAW